MAGFLWKIADLIKVTMRRRSTGRLAEASAAVSAIRFRI